MTGMFFAHGYPDIVLFDSGASHSFISSPFIVRNNPNDLELESTNVVYQIKSPGGRTATDQIARDIALDLDRHIYLASPLVLHHQGIDIIPGADWMNQYEGICLLTS